MDTLAPSTVNVRLSAARKLVEDEITHLYVLGISDVCAICRHALPQLKLDGFRAAGKLRNPDFAFLRDWQILPRNCRHLCSGRPAYYLEAVSLPPWVPGALLLSDRNLQGAVGCRSTREMDVCVRAAAIVQAVAVVAVDIPLAGLPGQSGIFSCKREDSQGQGTFRYSCCALS